MTDLGLVHIIILYLKKKMVIIIMFSIVKTAEPPRNASRLLARPEGGSEMGTRGVTARERADGWDIIKPGESFVYESWHNTKEINQRFRFVANF